MIKLTRRSNQIKDQMCIKWSWSNGQMNKWSIDQMIKLIKLVKLIKLNKRSNIWKGQMDQIDQKIKWSNDQMIKSWNNQMIKRSDWSNSWSSSNDRIDQKIKFD